MRVIVNGEHREVAAQTVNAQLSELDSGGTQGAIAANFTVLPKDPWADPPRSDRTEPQSSPP